MDSKEFRVRGTEMVEYICKYMETLMERRVTPSVEPGYLRHLLPDDAPHNPENWDDIMRDVETKIMPGVTHWQHPRFHAYFPAGNSYPSILGDMLGDGIGCIGFSWAASPACTELETIVLDWLGKAIGLPDDFLALKEGSKGGGVIQTSASECILVTMLAARAQAIKHLKQQHPFVEEGHLLSKLMAYCSKEAHSCVEKAAMICFVKLRILEPDNKCSLRGDTLTKAMEEDELQGLVPFFVSTTLGTTGACAFDALEEIGIALQRFPGVWLHVDAAYAGNAFICPELKPLLKGIEYADSFNTNSNKWLLVNFDCSTLWVRDRIRLTSALVVDPLYLKHGYSDAAIDYRHWGVPLSRRFRSLKLWFVLRNYGISGLQNYIRKHIELAKRFESHVLKDKRFEICNEVKLGLVCFRLVGADKLNEKLLSTINGSGKLHMVPASVNEKYVIRFCAVAQSATEEDIDIAWDIITDFATELLEKEQADQFAEIMDRKRKETLAQKRSFFVRMVSDPKIYNPAINKAGTPRMSTEHCSPITEGAPAIQTPTSSAPASASWISWPLAFLFASSDDGPKSNVPIRFRHLDATMRLTPSRRNSATGGGSSPSPENENGSSIMISRSPKRSPVLQRKRGTSPNPNGNTNK
ncbi:tyrosine decarboxylase isoform X2 [Sitodiplosis mosellana]|uniref:tyrosine decarboxylase isoform X2 n=1 Tax=Sitodiplosis mosellana TaxID=263140 RepID=UPI002444FE93|nr:tyrosine decarboxylase isoform X2 [Sitodiplosis mosellana]XP_055317945.1 tyrosine decarboxylase isoform X2 [Sitodiplosis mosellana]